ncbi:MAG: superoxide dismutase [Methylococcales bacterium]
MTDMTRRNFLSTASIASAAAATVALGGARLVKAAEAAVTPTPAPAVVTTPAAIFPNPPLPYAETALDPVISSKTVGFHYNKHHLGALSGLNTNLNLPEFAAYKDMSLEQIMLTTANQKSLTKIFNGAASAVSHDFYWNSMLPNGGDAVQPTGKLLDMIKTAFGDFAAFKTKLSDVGVAHTGSGYVWLADNGGKLEIMSLPNYDNPKMLGMKPLLTIDVFEHAYYLDYQNVRKSYMDAVIAKLINWNKASERLGA